MIKEITKSILTKLPEETLLTQDDITILKSNKEFIVSLVDEIVKDFYDVLFKDESSRKIFYEDERQAREHSLKDWFAKRLTETLI